MFEEEIRLRDYFHVIRKRRWVIITVLFIVAVSITILTFRQTPVYEATAQILIEKEAPNIVNFKEVLELDSVDQEYYQTQYRILKSRTLVKEVLNKLNLLDQTAQQESDQHTFSMSTLLTTIQEFLGLYETLDLSEEENITKLSNIIEESRKFLTEDFLNDRMKQALAVDETLGRVIKK